MDVALRLIFSLVFANVLGYFVFGKVDGGFLIGSIMGGIIAELLFYIVRLKTEKNSPENE